MSLCLSFNFPINIVWGPSYNQIYNDGYRVIVAERHPTGMGMAYDECWASAWDMLISQTLSFGRSHQFPGFLNALFGGSENLSDR